MNITTNKLVQASIILMGLALLYMILQQFAGFLRPFSIAVLLTFLTIGFFRLETREKLIKSSYILGTFFIISIILFTSYQLNIIGDDDIDAARDASMTLSQTQNQEIEFQQLFQGSQLSNFISFERLTELSQQLIQIVLSSFSTFISELFLVLLFWAFIIPSYDSTLKVLQDRYFKNNKKHFQGAIKEIEHGIKSYLGIKTVISFGTAFFSGIVLFLFGVPNVLILSILIFALNYIPTIGSFVAVAIALGIFAVQDGFTTAFIILAILLSLIQVLFGNIIEPKIAGKGLKMSPLLILFALFFWGTLWGVGGMLISVPLTHAIKTAYEALSQVNES